jgi:electron transport complex protein RnfE
MKEKTMGGVFINGIVNENPTLRLVLGICPTLASTTAAINGIGMGAAATFVLVGSNLVISLLRKFIPDGVRIPAFITVICTFVTIVEMFIKAYVPSLYESLGVFIPLIVVNCIILARAEAFASKNGPALALADGLGMGIGFTVVITLIGMFREVISSGTVFGMQVMWQTFEPMQIIGMAPGGFITLGLTLGLANWITSKAKKKKSLKGSAA